MHHSWSDWFSAAAAAGVKQQVVGRLKTVGAFKEWEILAKATSTRLYLHKKVEVKRGDPPSKGVTQEKMCEAVLSSAGNCVALLMAIQWFCYWSLQKLPNAELNRSGQGGNSLPVERLGSSGWVRGVDLGVWGLHTVASGLLSCRKLNSWCPSWTKHAERLNAVPSDLK